MHSRSRVYRVPERGISRVFAVPASYYFIEI